MIAIVFLFFLPLIAGQNCPIAGGITIEGDILSTACNISLCQIPAFLYTPIFGPPIGPTCIVGTQVTLTEDYICGSLQVTPGALLHTNGYRIFVSGTLNLMGTIINNGGAGTVSLPGSGTNPGTLGAGGMGGIGSALLDGTDGQPPVGVAVQSGISMGGAGTDDLPYAHGGLGGPITVSNSANYNLYVYSTMNTLLDLNGNRIGGGSGGGGGALVTGDTGGNGGGGGGVIAIFAKKIIGTGTVNANGGAASPVSSSIASSAGGAGGGGGGFIYVVTSTPHPTINLLVNGGAGGAGGTPSGNPGSAGQAGKVIVKILNIA